MNITCADHAGGHSAKSCHPSLVGHWENAEPYVDENAQREQPLKRRARGIFGFLYRAPNHPAKGHRQRNVGDDLVGFFAHGTAVIKNLTGAIA